MLALVESAASWAVFGGLLFGVAGTTHWTGAWAWLGILAAASVVMTLLLDPNLLKERVTALGRRRLRVWDAVWASAIGVTFLGWFVVMALDAGRYGWTTVPAWAQVVGAVAAVATFVVSFFVFRANVFASPVVDIQAERAQTVVTTGPYAVVRHPLYASVIWFWPATALLLGSVYGLVLSPLLVALVAVRTALEDRTLANELDGYRDYAARTRYRLVPGVW